MPMRERSAMPSADEPLHAVDQVVVHPARELALGRVREALAEAGRAAVVDLQHGVAAVGQELGLGVVAPRVAGPRPPVHHQHRGQVAGLGVEGQRQVRPERQAVARGDRHRAHRRQRRGVEPRARAVEELGRAGAPVVEEGRPRVAVVVEGHHPGGLLGVLAGDARVAGVQRPDGLPVAAEAGVEGVHHDPVAQVRRPEQLAGEVADDRPGEVGLVVAVDLALGPVGGVELHQPLQVGAAGAAHPQARAVGRERERVPAVLVRELGDDAEIGPLVVAHQQLVVAGRRLRPRRPQQALAVGEPADDVAGVAGHEAEPAGGEREPVGVEDGALAQVHRHQDVAGRGPRGGDQAGPHPGERRQVARAATGRGGGEDVVVLVAARVLRPDDEPGVARPQVGAHAAVAVVGDGPGLAARAVAHPDVQDAVARGEPGERPAVGGEARERPLGVAEEVAQGDQRGHGGHRATRPVARPPARIPLDGRVTLPLSSPGCRACARHVRLHEEPPFEVERPAVWRVSRCPADRAALPRPGSAAGGHGTRALGRLPGGPSHLRGGQRRPRVRPRAPLLRGPRRGPHLDAQLPARDPHELGRGLARGARERRHRRHRHGPLPGRVLGAGGLRQPELRGGAAPGAGARRRHHRRLGGDAAADGGAAGRQRRGRRGPVPRGRRGVAGELQQPRPDRRLGPAPRRRAAARPRPHAGHQGASCWTSTARSTRP